ncbi:MAG: WD40 repeat domain-containing protein, partial [Isosphaeraceae bacterium]
TLRVWDLAKRRDTAWLERHASAGYRSVAFSPDGRTLVAGNFDGSLAFVNTDGWVWHHDENTGSRISAVAFVPGSTIVAAGGWDGQVKFYHPYAKIDSHRAHYPGFIYAIAFSPDGSTLAVGGEAKMIQLYDVATFRLKAVLQGHAHAVESRDFSPDGKLIASAGGVTVRIWDVASGKISGAPIHHSPEVLCIRFSADGKLLAISDRDSGRLHSESLAAEIVIFDVATRAEVLRLRGHANSIYALAFSPDGKTLASGSMDQTVKLWDVESGELRETIVPGEPDKSAGKPAGAPGRMEETKR